MTKVNNRSKQAPSHMGKSIKMKIQFEAISQKGQCITLVICKATCSSKSKRTDANKTKEGKDIRTNDKKRKKGSAETERWNKLH